MSKKQYSISNIIHETTNQKIAYLDSNENNIIIDNHTIPINYSYDPRFRKVVDGYEDLNLDFNEHHGKDNAMIIYHKMVKYAIHKDWKVLYYETNDETNFPGICIRIPTTKYIFKVK